MKIRLKKFPSCLIPPILEVPSILGLPRVCLLIVDDLEWIRVNQIYTFIRNLKVLEHFKVHRKPVWNLIKKNFLYPFILYNFQNKQQLFDIHCSFAWLNCQCYQKNTAFYCKYKVFCCKCVVKLWIKFNDGLDGGTDLCQ